MSIDFTQQSNVRAFPAYPCIDCYFPSQSIEDARQRLTSAIERGDGPGLVIGATGTGKSLLLQAIAHQFADRFELAQLSSSQLCTRRALLQAILFELGLPYQFHEEGELRLSLLDHLSPNEQCPHGILLLVDEAQTLPVRLLEEIRLLTNLVRDGRPRVRLVLAGSAALEEQFATIEMESFQQRIAARCYLAPLGANEIGPYVQAHLVAGGADFADIRFDDDAIHAIYSATDGVPRLVNQICDRVLRQQLVGPSASLDARAIQEAWADLQRLPTPWQHSREAAPESLNGAAECDGDGSGSSSEVVEFGELSANDGFPPLDEDSPLDDTVAEADLPEPTPDASEIPEESGPDSSQTLLEICLEGTGENEVGLASDQPSVEAEDDSQALTELSPSPACDSERPASANPDSTDEDESSAAARCPKVEFAIAEQPAHNPFEESFSEEEIVLEDFAALGEVLHGRTPRVECRLDQQISQLVHDVECFVEQSMESESADELDLLDLPNDTAGEVARETVEEAEPKWGPVVEVDLLKTVPLISHAPENSSRHLESYDPVLPEKGYAPADHAPKESCGEAESVTIKYPGAAKYSSDELAASGAPSEHDSQSTTDAHGNLDADSRLEIADACPLADDVLEPTDTDEEGEDILVVEDTPVDFIAPSESVQRQEYRQLFAKLRGS